MISILQTKLPELRDHYLVQYILGKIVNYVCNCELVEQNNIDEMEDYPFVTFNWITLNNPTTSDWLKDHPQYVCTMQVDIHATTSIEALELAGKLYTALHESPYARAFKQAQIVPQKITNTSNRTTLSGINYDNDYGFDCSFLVNGNFTYQEEDLQFDFDETEIKSINAAGNTELTDGTVTNN